MHEELIKRLRNCTDDTVEDCTGCPYRGGYEGTYCMNGLITEAADAIEELIRRETPMRLRITTSTKRCPSCNKQVSGIGNIHGNYRYCRWCGQAIDWSEPPKEEKDGTA